MARIRFSNILLEQNPRSLQYPSLYCSSTAPVVFDECANVWKMAEVGTFDFTTYFNSLSVKKLARYTAARKYYLHLELKGAACTVLQTRAGVYSYQSEAVEGSERKLESSSSWNVCDMELAVDPSDVLVGFSIQTEGEVLIRNSYYSVELPDGDVREVELALATTTFKKEEFIETNIALVKKDVLGSDEPIAKHFHMHVIDNGRTLDASVLSDGRVTVYPNDNVGGAGGFARGMIEAMRQDPVATHVLLMDDDVAVSPESIKRTYNLLRILSEEYRDAFISGAMLNYEIGEDQWEDLGFMTEGGFCRPVKNSLRVSLLHDLVLNESIEPTEEQEAVYAAWWYCCIPVSTIKREGLPLPIFVRYDDVEYGLRCAPPFITMNGICIWHLAFHARYSAAVERYQTTRNAFIAQAVTGMAPKSDFLVELRHNLQLELKKFNYTNAELVLDGFEDFLKGPDFISQPIAEDRFMAANRNAEKLLPFEELKEAVTDVAGLDLDEIDEPEVYRDEPRSKWQALMAFSTFNGQRMFDIKGKSNCAVIPYQGWFYPAGKIHGVDVIIGMDVYNQKGVIRRKDKRRFKEVWKRYKKDMREYKRNKTALEQAYRQARGKLTSAEFWKDYLGIE